MEMIANDLRSLKVARTPGPKLAQNFQEFHKIGQNFSKYGKDLPFKESAQVAVFIASTQNRTSHEDFPM